MRTMLSLAAVFALSVVAAEPQWSYNYNALGHPGALVPGYPAPLNPYPYQYQYQQPYHLQYQAPLPVPLAAAAIPQDTSRGIPQPVQDTPEVKAAKELFAQEYEKAALLAKQNPDTGIQRRRRDVSGAKDAVSTVGVAAGRQTYPIVPIPLGLGSIYPVGLTPNYPGIVNTNVYGHPVAPYPQSLGGIQYLPY